jgi:phage tail-like protein
VENAEYPFTTFNFRVQLTIPNASGLGLSSPLCQSEFSECDGLEMTMELKTVREGGNNTEYLRLVGPVTFGNLTLKRGMTSNQDLWKWFTTAAGNTGRGIRASGVILMCDAAGKPRVRYTLFDCLPIKIKGAALNAKDGILAVEEMQLAYKSFQVESVTQ